MTTSEPRLGSAAAPWLGVLMLAHLAAVCVIKVARDTPEEVWWVSHVSLGLAGAGLVLRSRLLVTAPLVCVLIPHAIWLIDCIGWMVSGVHVLGLTAYLADADAWVWIATAHHFYLAPTLLMVAVRGGGWPRSALPLAVLVSVVLTSASRGVLPAGSNVNHAHRIMPQLDLVFLEWANGLAALPFLALLNVGVGALLFFPTAFVLQRLSTARDRSGTRMVPTASS